MTFITSWDEFSKAAERLYLNDPMKVRNTVDKTLDSLCELKKRRGISTFVFFDPHVNQ